MSNLLTRNTIFLLSLILALAVANGEVNQSSNRATETLTFASKEAGKGSFRIIVMASDGTQKRAVWKEARSGIDPVWSPDHKRIAFSAIIPENEDSDLSFEEQLKLLRNGLVVMNADGSNPRMIVQSVDDKIICSPAWSPDGKEIVYSQLEVTPIANSSKKKVEYVLYKIGLDRRNKKRLGQGMMPAWSPDGKYILYTLFDSPPAFKLNVMNKDGNGSRTLAEQAVGGAWSPDGKQIAYTRITEHGYYIYIMNADGSEAKPISTETDVSEIGPQWSADGKELYFSTIAKTKPLFQKMDICSQDVKGEGRQILAGGDGLCCIGNGTTFFIFVMQRAVPSKPANDNPARISASHRHQ